MIGIALLLSPGCRAPQRPYVCDPAELKVKQRSRSNIDPHALAAWRCNRTIVRRAVAEKRFSIRQLDGARQFFLELTGIELSTMRSHLGRLPGAGIDADLERLDSWLQLHGERLVWDRTSGEIRLASPTEAD